MFTYLNEAIYEGLILESAIATPYNVKENIKRGTEAMRHVISTHAKEYHAMYRKELGWIAFSWGETGTPPPNFKNRQEAIEWWANLPGKTNAQKGSHVFPKGRGISHIIAKRNWEAKWMKRFAGQSGTQIALELVEVIAKGTISSNGSRRTIIFGKMQVTLIADSRWIESKDARQAGKKKEEYWVLSGFEVVDNDEEYGIFESADGTGGSSHPARPMHTELFDAYYGVGAANPNFEYADVDGSRVRQSILTHTMPTVTRNNVGAADPLKNLINDSQKVNMGWFYDL